MQYFLVFNIFCIWWKAWSLGWRFSKAKKMCFLYQTYKLKLSNLERKLFIGMVCKKMGEEVDLNTLPFLCKHFLRSFFHWLSTLQDIRQMFDKFGPVEEVTVLRDDQGVSRGKYLSRPMWHFGLKLSLTWYQGAGKCQISQKSIFQAVHLWLLQVDRWNLVI